MKMDTLLSILCLIICLNELMASVSDDVALEGSNYTVKCNFEVEYPSWTVAYNTTYYQDITISGSSTINRNFHAKERIAYDTNKKDLKLSNVTSGDAGIYICSYAAQNGNPPQKSILNLDVDVFEVKDLRCPEGGHRLFYVETECVTPGAVKVNWSFVSTNDGRTIRYLKDITKYENATECPSGKIRMTSHSHYTPGTSFMKRKVHIMVKLSYSAGNSSRDLNKICSQQSYYINGSCSWEFIWWIFVLVSSIALLICEMFSCYKCRQRIPGHKNKVLALSIIAYAISCVFSSAMIGKIVISGECFSAHLQMLFLLIYLFAVGAMIYCTEKLISFCKCDGKKRCVKCFRLDSDENTTQASDNQFQVDAI